MRPTPPRWRVVFASLLVVLQAAPALAGATDPAPLSDDAGSGRDAGDTREDAVLVALNTRYSGVFWSAPASPTDIFSPIRDTDWYTFDATAGTEIVAKTEGAALYWMRLFDPDGTLVAETPAYAGNFVYNQEDSVSTGKVIHTVDRAGGWTLMFEAVTSAGPYAFAISASAAPVPAAPIPAGCSRDFVMVAGLLGAIPRFTDHCYHMRTGLNHLDTAIIDVLIVPPVGPWAERDLRMMLAAVRMWDSGIHQLARERGLDWLDESVRFNILIDDGEVATDPLWDPEIVVVVANPVLAGVQGVGIDPIGSKGPCRGANPWATAADWGVLPGFVSHHDGRSGTYVEDCPGGGSTCYAVSLSLDVVPGFVENVADINTHDLVAHEFGHCLSVGHVGDALDHEAERVPSADIMAYAGAPHRKCVSSLDLEAFAMTVSRFVLPEAIGPNDAPFHIQHPADHVYASPTGRPEDCPQPDGQIAPGVGGGLPWPHDDAGSGRDAGNTRSEALAVATHAVHAAAFLPQGDLEDDDWYAFDAEEGTTLVAMTEGAALYWIRLFDPDGLEVAARTVTFGHYAYNVFDRDAFGITYEIDRSGTWWILFEPFFTAGPYSFELDVRG